MNSYCRYSDRPRFDRGGDRRDRDYGSNNRDYGSRDFGGGRGDYGNNRRFDRRDGGDDRDSRRDSGGAGGGGGGWDGFRQVRWILIDQGVQCTRYMKKLVKNYLEFENIARVRGFRQGM